MGTIAEKLQGILDSKSAIRNSIIAKGISVDEETKLSEYAGKVDAIPISTSFYGVVRDVAVSNSAMTRVGNSDMHITLPIHSLMRRCLLLDNGTVNYYLHPTNSNLKADGSAAVLDGTDGQVMVEIPKHYRRIYLDGNFEYYLISELPLQGFELVPLQYESAYEASIDRSNAALPKLASVVNLTSAFRGGNNTSAWDNTYRSLLGRPGTSVSLTDFRTFARRRGSDRWNCEVYTTYKASVILYYIEYANLNCQIAFNAQPTAQGYKQGGLSDGVTTLNSTDWNNFNSYNPFVPCGHTNSLGNTTGVVPYVMPAEYGSLTVNVPSYRGIENIFGHVWKWTDGCKCRIQAADSGALSQFYVSENPSSFNSVDYTGYTLKGLLPRTEGYIKRMLIGELMASEVGASSVTYYSDYFYTSIPGTGEAQRGVLFGGSASHGARAGLSCASANYAASSSTANVGSRLCYIPV